MGLINGLTVFVRILCHIILCYLEAFVNLFKPPNRKSIAGEVVLITGAGQGIGRQLALELSKLGTTMVLWDLHKDDNEKTAEEINQAGGKAFAYVCNVTDTAQIASVAAKVREEVGEVSIVINNAGVLNGKYLMDLEEREIRSTFEVNILSHFWMNKEFLPYMMSKNHGHIFNVVSMAGFGGVPVLSDYSASKAAALNFSEALRVELSELGYTGIKVSALCPMFVGTDMIKKFKIESNVGVAPMLTTEGVARIAVDGLLRDHEVITIPGSMWYSRKLLHLMPIKAQNDVYTFGLVKLSPEGKKEN